MDKVTFSQNFEDVRLWRALNGSVSRTYIDVGAGDPTTDSVTRLFYNSGWSGINIEPGEAYDRLAQSRLRDVNLRAAAGAVAGQAHFFVHSQFPDLGSISPEFAVKLGDFSVRESPRTVEVIQLSQTLEDFDFSSGIDFLKLDCEGSELNVLSTFDWTRWRPRVVVVEVVEPLTLTRQSEQIEEVMLNAGYGLAFFDGVNCFFVDRNLSEFSRLCEAIEQPIFPIDGWRTAAQIEMSDRLTYLEAYHSWALAKLTSLDRDSKILRVEFARSDSELRTALELAEVRAARDNADIWRQKELLRTELDRVYGSRAWRVGRLVGLPIRGLRKFVRLIQLSEKGSPAPGFESHHEPGPDLHGTQAAEWEVSRRRNASPRLLSGREWNELREEFAADTDGTAAKLLLRVDPAAQMPGRAQEAIGDFGRQVVVIDARCLQIPGHFGIKTVSSVLFEVLCRELREQFDIQVILSASGPRLESLGFEGPYSEWLGTTLRDVVAYVQLAPGMAFGDDSDLALVQSRGVAFIPFWYDFIPAHDPDSFLSEENALLHYQYLIERLRYADVVLTLSDHVSREVTYVLGNPVECETEVIRIGCFSSLEEPAGAVRSSNDIVVFGNGLPHKNLHVGIIAASWFVGSADRGTVIVVANLSSNRQAELRELASQHGCSDIRFVYGVDDGELAKVLSAALVTVVPSRDEGFSIPVVDAITSGSPVVASRIEAHVSLLGDGPWLADADDPASFYQAIRAVLSSRNRLLRLQAATVRPNELRNEFVSRSVSLADRIRKLHENRLPLEQEAGSIQKRARLPVCKVCQLADFSDPDLVGVMRDVFEHETVRFGAAFPTGREWRKYWEVAMAVRTLRDANLLNREVSVLGIGAGNEPTLFYLTRLVGQVIATDLYEEDGWEESASASMLSDPGFHWPFLWEPDRLKVLSMNALDLSLPDSSVDAIFSSSSVEHFGDFADVVTALAEAHRVLRPGGVLSLSSEARLVGDGPGIPGALMFSRDEILNLVSESGKWEFFDELSFDMDPATIDTVQPFERVVRDHMAKIEPVGSLLTHHMEYESYPHIVLNHDGFTWTSFHIALRRV